MLDPHGALEDRMCRSMRRGLGLLPGYAEGNLTTSLGLRLSGLEYRHIRLLPQVDDDICYVRPVRCQSGSFMSAGMHVQTEKVDYASPIYLFILVNPWPV